MEVWLCDYASVITEPNFHAFSQTSGDLDIQGRVRHVALFSTTDPSTFSTC